MANSKTTDNGGKYRTLVMLSSLKFRVQSQGLVDFIPQTSKTPSNSCELQFIPRYLAANENATVNVSTFTVLNTPVRKKLLLISCHRSSFGLPKLEIIGSLLVPSP